MDWPAALDLSRAQRNCDTDILGDWYRDLWGWPEPRWAVSRSPGLVYERLDSVGVKRVAKIDVPKENFATRPAVVMDPLDRLVYQALVDRISVRLAGSMKAWVYGWRLPPEAVRAGAYARNDYQYDSFRTHLSQGTDWWDFVLSTDIVSFFASIPVERACDMLEQRARDGRVTERLCDLLNGWARVPGRSGIPQRHWASSLLASAYLEPVDLLLDRHTGGHTFPFPSVARWMDDIWIFATKDGVLRQLQRDLELGMRDLGLNMNASKTNVYDREEAKRVVRSIEHSAVDAGLSEDPSSTSELEALIAAITEAPERASKTSVRFALTRIRAHNLWTHLDAFARVAHRMPHAADHLARFFREGERWRSMGEWFMKYRRSPWATIDWSVSHFARMFPPDSLPDKRLVDEFADELTGSASLAISTVAVHRLASWDPERARAVVRARAPDMDSALRRRAFDLSVLQAGEERTFVRRLLGEFEENRVTLKMLEATSFVPPKTVPDY